jgi:hypothetical protein
LNLRSERRAGGLLSRKVLLGLATDPAVLAAIAPQWDGKGFSSRWENLFAGWCVKHYLKYGKPVGRDIGGYFDLWASKNRDEDVQDAVARLVEAVSDDAKSKHKPSSSEFLIDAAKEIMTKAALERMYEEGRTLIQRGEVEEATALVEKFRRVEVGSGSMISLFKGGVAVRNAFKNVSEVLIKWPQPALAQFFGNVFARGEFVAFMAGEKMGKSFDLQEVGVEGVKQGNNVAFFEVGDQTRPQIIRRFAARVAERPAKADTGYKMPLSLEVGEAGDAPRVKYKVLKEPKAMSDKEADAFIKKFGKQYGDDSLRLSVHPNSSINVQQIDHLLQEWRRDGWLPDIIVIDYADILAPLNGSAETRDQINATWKALRGLGQKWDACMVTATQADAASYKAHTLSRTNFSEDKRKYAHVTAMIGINRTEKEYEQGIARMNFILARDLEFSSEKCVYVAPCFAVANPWVFSSF